MKRELMFFEDFYAKCEKLCDSGHECTIKKIVAIVGRSGCQTIGNVKCGEAFSCPPRYFYCERQHATSYLCNEKNKLCIPQVSMPCFRIKEHWCNKEFLKPLLH